LDLREAVSQDRLDLLGPRVSLWDPRDLRDQVAFRVQQDSRDQLAFRGSQESRAPQDFRGPRDFRDPRESLDLLGPVVVELEPILSMRVSTRSSSMKGEDSSLAVPSTQERT